MSKYSDNGDGTCKIQNASPMQPFVGVYARTINCSEFSPKYETFNFINKGIDELAVQACGDKGSCPTGLVSCWKLGQGNKNTCKCFNPIKRFNYDTKQMEDTCPRWGDVNPDGAHDIKEGYYAEYNKEPCDFSNPAASDELCCVVTGRSDKEKQTYNGFRVKAAELPTRTNAQLGTTYQTCHDAAPYMRATASPEYDFGTSRTKSMLYNGFDSMDQPANPKDTRFPNITCNSSAYTPGIMRAYDSKNEAYLKCYKSADPDLNSLLHYANENVTQQSYPGKFQGKWCDNGTGCDSGAKCCRDPDNTSKDAYSGRCVWGASCGLATFRNPHWEGNTYYETSAMVPFNS